MSSTHEGEGDGNLVVQGWSLVPTTGFGSRREFPSLSLPPSFFLFTPETQEARFVGYSLMQVYTSGAITSKSCLRTYAGRSGQLHVHRGCCALARSWLRASWIVFHLNSSGACVNVHCLSQHRATTVHASRAPSVFVWFLRLCRLPPTCNL